METTVTIKADDLLDQIEDLSNLAKSCSKKGGKDHVDALLDSLDKLISLSADRFMTLGDSNHNDIEDEEYEQYIVHPNDLIKAKSFCSSILLKLISTELTFEDEKDDERMERASRLLAHMSGRGGMYIKIGVNKSQKKIILIQISFKRRGQLHARGTFRT